MLQSSRHHVNLGALTHHEPLVGDRQEDPGIEHRRYSKPDVRQTFPCIKRLPEFRSYPNLTKGQM